MKKVFLPYYISRALLSLGFSALVFGLSWKALLAAVVFFALFLLYLHSGWFSVDPSHPLSPLRRDERAREIQRRSLIAAVGVGLVIYILLPLTASWLAFSPPTGPLALSAGVLAYFATQFILLSRS
jgi:sterol desaturase/sphingolipid hydroxylase (fatty acid hydroxylase superfamily)